MERRIHRSYAFSDREIHEALIAWIKAKDVPCPSYVANTPDTKWVKEPNGIRVEWTEEGEIEL